MKRFFLTLILCGFVGVMYAQDLKYGVTTGLNISNLRAKFGFISMEMDWKAGFQAGVFLDYAITPQLSLIPELLFTQKGTKINPSISIIDSEGNFVFTFDKITLNYIQLPINAAYKFDIGNGQKFFPFAGAYLSYGLFGTAKGKTDGQTESEKIKFGLKEDMVKPLDYGLNIGAGYQYTHIIFKLQYNLGLPNLSNGNDSMVKNKNFAVTISYMF